jgi:hypothetical protein
MDGRPTCTKGVRPPTDRNRVDGKLAAKEDREAEAGSRKEGQSIRTIFAAALLVISAGAANAHITSSPDKCSSEQSFHRAFHRAAWMRGVADHFGSDHATGWPKRRETRAQTGLEDHHEALQIRWSETADARLSRGTRVAWRPITG